EAQVLLVRFDSHGNLRRRLRRCLHAQEEFELDPDLVEQVIGAVVRLGYRRACIGESVRLAQCLLALVDIEQRPYGYAGVDDVFAVVAGVVPAAGEIEGVVATRPLVAVPVDARAAGGCLLRVTRRTGPLRSGEYRIDGDVTAVVIEVRESVELQVTIRGVCNVERVACRASAFDAESLTLSVIVAEIDKVHVLSRRSVFPEDARCSAVDGFSLTVCEFPLERCKRRRGNHGALGGIRVEACLVQADGNVFAGCMSAARRKQ